MRTTLIVLSALALASCGGAQPDAEPAAAAEAPASQRADSSASPSARGPEAGQGGRTAFETVSDLICAGDRCGASEAECAAQANAIFEACFGALREQVPEDPTPEQQEHAMLMTTLCSMHVYRERRVLDGHACAPGEEVPEPFRAACLLCSVAAGTRSAE